MGRFSLKSFVFFLFTIFTINAQEWININPSFDPPGIYDLHRGIFVDNKSGWFIEFFPARVWISTNGGFNWKIQKDTIDVWLHDIQFIDSLQGWVVGETIIDRTNFLWRTKDGGNSWEKISVPKFYNLTFLNSLEGFAGGDSIYSTTDGGESWQTQTIEPDVPFGVADIYFVDKHHGWAVGGSVEWFDMGIILKTTNTGEIWHVNRHPAEAFGYAVYFTDTLHGYVVGSNPPFFQGVIMVTNDGGENWQTKHLPGSWLNDVAFMNDSTGWVVGDYGFLWVTKDGGSTWERVEIETNSDLNRIILIHDDNLGYIFGKSSTILRCNRVVNNVKVKNPVAPSVFKLYQNYPNPFNPSTTIEFRLPKTTNVALNIFNILGEEVATLVSEKLFVGSYTYKWNASNTASGVYLYRLEADDFVETRKMVLMR